MKTMSVKICCSKIIENPRLPVATFKEAKSKVVTVHRGLPVKLGIGIGESHAVNFRHDHHEDEINGRAQQLISDDIIASAL